MARIVVLGSRSGSLLNFRGLMIERLVGEGHEVIGCAPGRNERVEKGLERLGALYFPVKLSRTGLSLAADLESLIDLVRVLRRLKPAALFSYTIKPVVYGSIAARVAGVPRIYSMITGLGYTFLGTTWKQRVLNAIVKPLYRAALRLNRGVFFQNEDDADLFVELGLVSRAKITLTGGSGVDLDHYPVEPLPKPPVRFLMCGRILVEKGVREYLEAAGNLKQRYPDAQFDYLGPFDVDNPAGVSETQVSAWNRDHQVRFHGAARDVRPFFRECSVLVLPSYREGTPRTVLEAAAMGRPVITTDGPGGCRQTVRPGETGFLVPVKDSEALARAMERFIAQPELIEKMGAAGRRFMEEKFDVRKVNQTIVDAMGLNSRKLSPASKFLSGRRGRGSGPSGLVPVLSSRIQ